MNLNAFDLFTAAHFAVGVVMAAVGIPRSLAYLVIVGTEVLEVALRKRFPRFFAESLQNIAVDLAASAGGYELIRATVK